MNIRQAFLYVCLLTVCVTFFVVNVVKFYAPVLAERMRQDFMIELIRNGGQPQIQTPGPQKLSYAGSPQSPHPYPTPDSNEPPVYDN